MTKFIEVTDRDDNTKNLINIDRIISVQERRDGSAFIEVHIYDSGQTSYGLHCFESYIELYGILARSKLVSAI